MNEAEYIVAPQSSKQKPVSFAPIPPKGPKKPNKILTWVKSNIPTTVAGSIMAVIIIVMGVFMITGQKISLFGLQLNPLYQQASCTDDINNPCPNPIEDVPGCDPVDGYPNSCSAEAFSITGQFANGTVNVPYTQSFSVNPQTYSSVGGPIGMCNWTVVSVVPSPGFEAAFVQPDGGPGTTASFTSTPTKAGTYQVTIKVSCSNTGQETTKTLPWVVKEASTDLTIESDFGPATLGETYFSKLKAVNAGDAICTFSFEGSVPEIGNGVIDTSYRNQDGTIDQSQIKFVGNPQTPGDYTVTIGVECSPRVGDGPTKTATKTFNLKVNDVQGVPPGNTGLDLTANLLDGIVGTKYSGGVQTIHVGAGSNYTCRATVKNISPAISGAYVINAYAIGGELNGSFVTTPKNAGTYTVTFHAICFSRDARNPVPTVVFDKSFPWIVKINQIDPPAPTGTLDISANFTNGVVGTPYATEVKTVNSNGVMYTCKLTLKSVTPAITGAALNPTTQLITIGNETQSTFTATPNTAGNYTIKILAVCDPTNPLSKMVSIEKEKDFIWKVSEATTIIPTPSGELSIEASFANGKVNQAYNTSVTTKNGASNCNLALLSVTPTISGAILDVTSTVGGNPSGVAVASFKATPTTAGTYAVKLSATCPPLVGDGPTKYAEKSFSWIVDPASSGGGGGGGSSTPTLTNVCTVNKAKLVPIYRWWNNTIKDHFFTTNANEKPSGYISEGIAGYVFKEKVSGSTAVYRSYSALNTAHYYSTVNDAEKYGYMTEGVLGYAYDSSTTGTVPWYRLMKGWPHSDYLETISSKEKTEVIANLGYKDEGVAAYLCASI